MKKILDVFISIGIIIFILYVGFLVLKNFSIKAERINILCNDSDNGIVYYEGEKVNCLDWLFNESINAISDL